MKKILIVGPAWLGDMVMAQSLLILLKQQGAIIDVLATDWTFAVLERMPEVRRAISLPIEHGKIELGKRYQIGKSLREESYDQAIVLPNSFKSAIVPAFAHIPQRTGWLGEMRWGLLNDVRVLNKEEYPLMVQRFVALGYDRNQAWDKNHYRQPVLKVETNSVQEKLTQFNLVKTAGQPILALCPGAAFGETKKWPVEYFAEIANAKLNGGWQVWLFGSAKDQDSTSAIQQQTNHRCVDLSGKLRLDATVDLISQVSLVISNDSGLLHVAAALDIPLIGIYGSTSADFTPPLNDKVRVLGVEGLACRPCFKRTCQYQHLKCLRDLKPEVVMTAVNELV